MLVNTRRFQAPALALDSSPGCRCAPNKARRRSTWPGLARAGLGLALVPGNIVPPHFDGILLRPDPPVRRPLAVYTRVRPDPITAAFVAAIAVETLVTPPHITARLGQPAST